MREREEKGVAGVGLGIEKCSRPVQTCQRSKNVSGFQHLVAVEYIVLLWYFEWVFSNNFLRGAKKKNMRK